MIRTWYVDQENTRTEDHTLRPFLSFCPSLRVSLCASASAEMYTYL